MREWIEHLTGKEKEIAKLVALACSKAWNLGFNAPKGFVLGEQERQDFKAGQVIKDATKEIMKAVE